MTTEPRAARFCCRNARFVQLALDILFLYGAVKRHPRILMAGFIYEIFLAVLIGIWCLLIIIMPSVFTEYYFDRVNMSMSSAMDSEQGSSMSSQQQQEEMEAAGADFFISMLVTSMVIALIIMLAIQSMICYLYFVVYQEAKRFQNNQVVVQPAGVVMQQCNYSNYPQLYIIRLPNSHFNLPN
ncbi:hypothetical protein WR25_17736 [Diploscapter pachys]|uniref:Uncharacterized protein n=1 Tax=Diploscapter pachys TaxID=2018661 RepID=A0A2A2LPE9_9BILA|nr:hypothetical protein WR25_17736 [Diploscapter pachys]